MVYTFKLTDGALTFTNGKIDMVGKPDAFDFEELMQRLTIRFQTMILSDVWRPFEGFDFKGISENKFKYEQTGVTVDELLRQNATNTIFQDPDVTSVDSVETEELDNREWSIKIQFHNNSNALDVTMFYTSTKVSI